MKTFIHYFYSIVLALWVGGMASFTFIVTPRIFSHYDRDMAAEIVNALFPGYFAFNFLLSAAASVLLIALLKWGVPGSLKLSFVITIIAVGINLFIMLKLHPQILEVKGQIVSFITTPPDSPLRQSFKRLHAVSAVLNLMLMLSGAVLIYLQGLFRH